jgi:hypothetical protein
MELKIKVYQPSQSRIVKYSKQPSIAEFHKYRLIIGFKLVQVIATIGAVSIAYEEL